MENEAGGLLLQYYQWSHIGPIGNIAVIRLKE